MAAVDLVVAMTGASGSAYAVRLIEVLLRAGRTVHLTISPAAVEVLSQELDQTVRLEPDAFDAAALLGPVASELDLSRLCYHHYRDFRAGIASGSFLTAGMVVCPCSMGTLSAIAHGTSDNLIHRAAGEKGYYSERGYYDDVYPYYGYPPYWTPGAVYPPYPYYGEEGVRREVP